jgi:hypothetical protein
VFDIILIEREKVFHTVVGLLVAFRLWRFSNSSVIDGKFFIRVFIYSKLSKLAVMLSFIICNNA